MINFDPNKMKAPPVPEYATYIPDRRPDWKIHANRGHALNAFQYKDTAVLYRYMDNKWMEIYKIENWKAPPQCEFCCASTLKVASWGKYDSGSRIWVGRNSDSPVLVWLCYDCERVERGR